MLKPTGKKSKKFATASAPVIEAVTAQLLRLATEQQALDWLAMLEASFVTSKHQLPAKDRCKSVILWVKDYDLAPEEKAKGYLGHFIAVGYKQIDKRWTLYPTKMLMDLKHHPQRGYKNEQKHPNWGHPILRGIRKNMAYKTLSEATAALARLHEDFPTVSIPTPKKFYIMIFSREDNPAQPVQKYVLEIKALPDGRYGIGYQLNDKKSRKPVKTRKSAANPAKPLAGEDTSSEVAKGMFTARESLRRQQKRRK